MPTKKSLAKEYAEYLELNQDNPNVVDELAKRINSITFTKTQEPIPDKDKEEILNEITQIINSDERLITEAEDSTELIKLIQMIKEKTVKS